MSEPKRLIERWRRLTMRHRQELANIGACVLGLAIGIALGVLSSAGTGHHHRSSSHATDPSLSVIADQPAARSHARFRG